MGKKYAFIGVGNMGGAILGGMEKLGISRSDVCLFDPNPEQYKRFDPAYRKADSAARAAEFADVVFLCVKPQVFSVPLADIKASGISLSEKTLVSIVTGISIARLCETLGTQLPVVRVMPNTPMLIGRGVTALARNELVSDASFEDIKNLFAALSRVIILPEDQMINIIAETSSSPAYVFLFIKAMTEASEKYGFDPSEMLGVICDAVSGSAELLKTSGKTPDELIKMVCSPGGTTLAAMDVFYKNGFEQIIASAMDACTRRAEELSKS